MIKKTLVTAAATACSLLSLGLAPAYAEHTTEHCANGAVLVHANGASVSAESGDAKYQLVGIEGSYSGVYRDKSGTLTSYSGSFEKSWTSGKKDVALVCDVAGHVDGPTTGEYEDHSFHVTLRQVQ
jgi:hypothetical protein